MYKIVDIDITVATATRCTTYSYVIAAQMAGKKISGNITTGCCDGESVRIYQPLSTVGGYLDIVKIDFCRRSFDKTTATEAAVPTGGQNATGDQLSGHNIPSAAGGVSFNHDGTANPSVSDNPAALRQLYLVYRRQGDRSTGAGTVHDGSIQDSTVSDSSAAFANKINFTIVLNN